MFTGVADTNNVIGFAIGAMFVREVFHGEAKPQGTYSVKRLKFHLPRHQI